MSATITRPPCHRLRRLHHIDNPVYNACRLPVRSVARDATNQYEGSVIPALLRGRTILIVDDDDGVRGALAEMFMGMDVDVHPAVHGLHGLQQLEQCRPDVILSDLAMPAMGGLEFAQRVRQDLRFRHTPLIAMTGNVPIGMEIANAGFDGYLEKPFLFASLVELAWRLLDSRDDRRSA